MRVEAITSRQNALIQQFRKLQTSRSYRRQTGLFVADGTKLLREAAQWYEGLRIVLRTKDADCGPLPEWVEVYEISNELMAYVSGMEAPQGAIFCCAMPQENEPPRLAPGTLILDGIQDPGNVGTILRTADALGVPVLLSDGCADPYNAKTVRASMGAVFRTLPRQLSREEILQQSGALGIPLAATAMSEDAMDLRSGEPERFAVVIGSEGQGVCREFMDASQRKLIIPMQPNCESLNAAVAAAIVMWEMKR